MPMPSVSTRKYAVKKVYSAVYRHDHVFRRTDPHKVSRFFFRKEGHYILQNPVHIFMTLSHRKTPYSIARKIQLRNLLGMIDSYIRKNSPLVDAEKKLIFVNRALLFIELFHLFLTTKKPACRPLYGGFNILPVRECRRTLIEGHGNGGSQVGLDLHGLFRSHKNLPPVDVGAEFHSLFPNLSSGLC